MARGRETADFQILPPGIHFAAKQVLRSMFAAVPPLRNNNNSFLFL